HALHDLRHFLLGQWGWLVAPPHEPGPAGGVADDVPRVLVHDHLHQHVTREHAALDDTALAVFDLNFFLGRNHDIKDFVVHAHRLNTLLDGMAHLVLIAGVAVDHVPVALVVRPFARRFLILAGSQGLSQRLVPALLNLLDRLVFRLEALVGLKHLVSHDESLQSPYATRRVAAGVVRAPLRPGDWRAAGR